jgi:hypothetical protein
MAGRGSPTICKGFFGLIFRMVVDGCLSPVEKLGLQLPRSRGPRRSRQKYLGGDAAPPYPRFDRVRGNVALP